MTRADTWAALDAFAATPTAETLQSARDAVHADPDVAATSEWVSWTLALSPAALQALNILPTTRTP
jgi:hypothetical protein